MQTTGELIKLNKIRGHPIHPVGAVSVRVNLIHGRLKRLRKRHIVFGSITIRNRIYLSLRLINKRIDLAIARIPQLRDPCARLNQATHNRVLLHNIRVILSVCCGRDGGDQRMQVGGPTHASQFPTLLQLVRDSNRISRHTMPIQRNHRLIDNLVGWLIKIGGPQGLHHIRNSVLRKHHATQHRLLRHIIMR